MCVVGERHSGTNWLEDSLNLYFPGGQPHRPGMAQGNCHRHKHWFHYPGMLDPLVEDGDLIFVVVRNAVDWLLSMSRYHHHAYNHANLPFEDFLTRPWVPGTKEDVCARDEEFFLSTPYYETYRAAFGGPLEGPIRDVLQLRAMKLDNFLRLREWVSRGRERVLFVRYEDLLDRSGQGLRDLMSKDKSRFNVEGVCPSGEDQPVKDPADEGKSRNLSAQIEVGQVYYHRKTSGTAFDSPAALRIFLNGVDLELENKLGYKYDFLWNAALQIYRY